MTPFETLGQVLDRRAIAQAIEIHHDNIRISYVLQKNTADTFDDFLSTVADYLCFHLKQRYNQPPSATYKARSEAKEILSDYCRKQHHTLALLVERGKTGENGGMRVILDVISDELKHREVNAFIEHVFDSFAQENYDAKLELVRSFFQKMGQHLPPHINVNRPEEYVANYKSVYYAYRDMREHLSSTLLS